MVLSVGSFLHLRSATNCLKEFRNVLRDDANEKLKRNTVICDPLPNKDTGYSSGAVFFGRYRRSQFCILAPHHMYELVALLFFDTVTNMSIRTHCDRPFEENSLCFRGRLQSVLLLV